MKQTITTLAIVVTIATILAFANADNKSEGAIGDVKYSVLEPDKFREENGNGWVLMDDKVPIIGSTLNTKHQIREIPDVRGLFIRCLNGTRNDSKSDPYAKEHHDTARLSGSYQPDAVGKHTHPIDMKTGYMLNLGAWNPPTPPTSIFVADRPAYGNSYGALTATDASLPIIETRPKNIALYTYIKINE